LQYLIYIAAIFMMMFPQNNPSKTHYDFNAPIIKINLPANLQEISGITIIDSNTVACIQDENGILFLYDILLKKIKHQIKFGENGDYEGIAKVGTMLYILRSDGALIEIADYTAKKMEVKTYLTESPAFNNEGLCYDSINNRLIIGAKGKINKDPGLKDKRFIYEFNLVSKKINKEPLFTFDCYTINQFAKKQGIKLRKKTNKEGKQISIPLKLYTSEIAIHPITKKIFILSGADHCLFICSNKGTLEHIEPLDPLLFNKSEGLSFYKNGDMLISNEGQAHQPTLLKFNYKP
jgi:hypothetical protein